MAETFDVEDVPMFDGRAVLKVQAEPEGTGCHPAPEVETPRRINSDTGARTALNGNDGARTADRGNLFVRVPADVGLAFLSAESSYRSQNPRRFVSGDEREWSFGKMPQPLFFSSIGRHSNPHRSST